MKNTMQFLVTTIFSGMLLIISSPLQAEEKQGHDHHNHHDSSMNHDNHSSDMSGMFLVKQQIDGFDVSFHVMEAQKGMEHGGSHNFMIKIEQHGKVLNDLTINSKVIYPNGTDETKPLMKMGDWYMNGYDLGNEGKYQLMILFRTANGSKYKGGVYYPDK